MADYHAAAHATREKTARLRKLREAKEAADAKPSVKSAKGKRSSFEAIRDGDHFRWSRRRSRNSFGPFNSLRLRLSRS
jgi:hypothetical protein